MGIRMQPREVVICKDDPFRHDLLDRKEKAEVLTSLIRNIDGPCTMAVDAAWGAGKTTFLKMCEQHLRNEGFPVVEFNAWETDVLGEPFVALTSEITQGLRLSEHHRLSSLGQIAGSKRNFSALRARQRSGWQDSLQEQFA